MNPWLSGMRLSWCAKMKNALLTELFQKFALEHVKPLAREIDEEERFPEVTVKKMGAQGLLALTINESYGGVGASTADYINAVRILSRYCATTGVILSAHSSLCVDPIMKYGTEEQKAKYLPRLASGQSLGAFGLTEPNAGTDAGSQQTKAVLEGDEYVITGNKIFITNAIYADIYIIFALTEPSLGTKGISAFIVEKGLPGFSFGAKEKKMGIRGSSTTELILDHVRVPKSALLGPLNGGFGVAMGTLDGGRIGIAAQALGIAEGAFERVVEYVKKRIQFGKPISAFQNTQFKIAEMRTKIKAGELLLEAAAADKDNGTNYNESAAIAKLYNSRIAVEVCDDALQLLGGYGYIRDYEIERMYRDAKITEIYEGTSEVQKMVIAGKVLR